MSNSGPLFIFSNSVVVVFQQGSIKKTGCRRRNVIKEDLVAEDRRRDGELFRAQLGVLERRGRSRGSNGSSPKMLSNFFSSSSFNSSRAVACRFLSSVGLGISSGEAGRVGGLLAHSRTCSPFKLGWCRKKEDWLRKKERSQRRPGCRRSQDVEGATRRAPAAGPGVTQWSVLATSPIYIVLLHPSEHSTSEDSPALLSQNPGKNHNNFNENYSYANFTISLSDIGLFQLFSANIWSVVFPRVLRFPRTF